MKEIQELIKELQTVAERCDLDDNYDLNDAAEDAREIAGRLEKAVTLCNRLKMREALVMIQSGLNDEEDIPYLKALKEVVDEALSAPPRNCDVGDAEEQFARFKKWCEGEFYKRPMNALTGEPCKSCPCYSVAANGVDGCNYLRWAQMIYVEGETNE